MRAIPPELLVAVAAISVTIAFGQAFALALRGSRRRRRALVRASRAASGEERAAELLAASGFEILGAQVTTSYPVEVDGVPAPVTLRADYLVARDGFHWVVEVKTGSRAPRIETPATRRQLLEYRVAFDVDGVLLADPEAGRLSSVAFPGLPSATPSPAGTSLRPLLWLAVAACVVAAIAVTR